AVVDAVVQAEARAVCPACREVLLHRPLLRLVAARGARWPLVVLGDPNAPDPRRTSWRVTFSPTAQGGSRCGRRRLGGARHRSPAGHVTPRRTRRRTPRRTTRSRPRPCR